METVGPIRPILKFYFTTNKNICFVLFLLWLVLESKALRLCFFCIKDLVPFCLFSPEKQPSVLMFQTDNQSLKNAAITTRWGMHTLKFWREEGHGTQPRKQEAAHSGTFFFLPGLKSSHADCPLWRCSFSAHQMEGPEKT